MKRFVSAFGVPLAVAVGLLQGDGKLPLTASPLITGGGPSYSATLLPGNQGQVLILKSSTITQYRNLSKIPQMAETGDKIPHSYSVYGLRTGPGGMAFTDQNGVALPVPSHPRIITGPLNGTQSLPLLKVPPGIPVQPYYAPLPIPKK